MNDGARLRAATLGHISTEVSRPGYDRSAVATGIVHLGIGGFHRAHQAVYTDAVLAAGDKRWGILGASLRSPDTWDALTPQDGLYTVAVRDRHGERLQVVGSVSGVVVASAERELLLERMAAPDTLIVSLTVTEKGYCYHPATGELDEDHPDVRYDLAHPNAPRSAPGLIVEALRRRLENGHPLPTVLSCDNLPSNGTSVGRVVTRFAALRDAELGRILAAELLCPSTMVDRIVPATTDGDRTRIGLTLGVADHWPVITEPFSQWILEDRFALGRPQWEIAGAQFVSEVAPFERAKLRLLNGSHSTLAYLGCLAGYDTVADTIAAPGFATLIRDLMLVDVAPTLPFTPGFVVESYAGSLLERFANPALRHRTAQIAADGSQKLPQRLLDTARDRLRMGRSIGRLALGIGSWMRYVTGLDERGVRFEVRDPLADSLRRRTAGCSTATDLVAACLGLESVFGADLAGNSSFRASTEMAVARLLANGAAHTVATWTDEA